MQAFKAVKQSYTPTAELLTLLDQFRRMVNACIGVGVATNVTSMKALSKKAYHNLAAYDVATYYRLTAISKAAGILRNYRQALRKRGGVKQPHASQLMLTDRYGFRIIGDELRLPIRAREYIYIPLSPYVLRSIGSYTVRAVCLTACTLSVVFSKATAPIEAAGLIGIDRKLDNVTTASSGGDVRRYDLSRTTDIQENCRQATRGFRRNDYRIRKWLYAKYGRLQKNRVSWILHNTSASLVRQAKEKQFGLVMENLRGIRRLYRRGNGQGRDYRARLNAWSYAELQRQIAYKARWEGLPVFYVNPSGTSSLCATGGCHLAEGAERKVYCPRCKALVDREENAAVTGVRAGLRFSLKGVAGEARKGNPERGQAIPGAAAPQLPHRPRR